MTVGTVKPFHILSTQALQELADEAGMDIEEVCAAIQSAREAELRERIAQAVEDGTIPQAKADWLLEGLDQSFLFDGSGFGFGHPGPKFDSVPETESTLSSGG